MIYLLNKLKNNYSPFLIWKGVIKVFYSYIKGLAPRDMVPGPAGSACRSVACSQLEPQATRYPLP